MLPPLYARLVLLGYEESGKSCFVLGKSFQHIPPTEGADQLEINITTAFNWEVMDRKKI